MKSVEGRNILHFIFCSYGSWCGRVEGGSYEEAGSCFWCNNGLALVVVLVGGRGESTSGGGGSKRHSLQAVELSQRTSCHSGLKLLCKLCRTSPPPAMGAPIYRFFGMPAMRTRWMAGAAAHKSG